VYCLCAFENVYVKVQINFNVTLSGISNTTALQQDQTLIALRIQMACLAGLPLAQVGSYVV
jgi:hypothetical protein